MRTDLTNPKDLIGVAKLDMSNLPQVGLMMTAHALMDGEEKYSAANWLQYKVSARIYIAAMKRHLQLWEAGEELAPDSLRHHLAHLASSAMILMDAQANGTLLDDRIRNPAAIRALKDINKQIQMDYDAKKARAALTPQGEAQYVDGVMVRTAEQDRAVNESAARYRERRVAYGILGQERNEPLPASVHEVETEGQDRDPESSK